MKQTSFIPWNEVVANGVGVTQGNSGRIDIKVQTIDEDSFACKHQQAGVCCIVPRLVKHIESQQKTIDLLVEAEAVLINKSEQLSARINHQQTQIDLLVHTNQHVEEVNNVCNVLDDVFADILSEVNKQLSYNQQLNNWKQLRQHISRKKRNWKFLEEELEKVLLNNYQTTLLQFDRDVTGLLGIKGQRNRLFHPKISQFEMKKRAINTLTFGCLSNQQYSTTTLKLLKL